MPYSLLYVSRTLLKFPAGNAEVKNIVAVSLARNAGLDVTGALISTPSYFAQVLEGAQPAVAELMSSIRRDQRHAEVKILTEGEVPVRRFSNWSMAYSGYATYVDDYIEPFFALASPAQAARLSQRLIQLMLEFTRQEPGMKPGPSRL
ncbi:BLUF domain-containing protein [Acidocella aromatica]|uniref:BLUF domain-containing protein n=1 Tax=Acidocella aromatica TaxID=1303579 RepID=A0A840VJN0_9PROT|nr:BLUF domain-containing protein [Acidocella aromatica]MBB5371801.1 hypothetical protein [Acidocella aromatica]